MKRMYSNAKGTIVRQEKEGKMILTLDAKFPKEVLDMSASPDARYIYCVTEKSIKIYDTEEKETIHELKKWGTQGLPFPETVAFWDALVLRGEPFR